MTYPNGIAGSYAYDAASRLTGITYTLSSTTIGDLTYEYDAAGRRTRMGGSLARTGLPSAVSTAVYDEANRLVQWGSSVLSYDADGNLTADGANSYVWDARNRLASMNAAVFQYDAFGRRTLNSAGRGMVYDALNPVVELSGSAPQASMLMGLGLDEMFTRKDSSGVQALLTDALGSVVALADSTGSLATQYTYEPFGKTTASGAPSSNPFQYTGRENDGTGLDYYRARYYNSTQGRFISEDPMRFASGTNFYSYAVNNPLTFTDPLGLANYVIIVGQPGLGRHNVGNAFILAAQTASANLNTGGHGVSVVPVSNVAEFNSALNNHGTIDGGVMYFGHGWEGVLYPGETDAPGTNLDASNIDQLSNLHLTSDATINLFSCNAGKGGANSIAQLLANQLRRATTGYDATTFFAGRTCPQYSRPRDRAPSRRPVQMCPQGGRPPITFHPQ